MSKKVLVTVDDLKGLLVSGGDVAFVICIEVDDGLLFALFYFESLRVKALLLEFVLVDFVGVFGTFPHPTDHFHV